MIRQLQNKSKLLSQYQINIDNNNIYGKCDIKCSYTFNYLNTSVFIKNNEDNILLTFDKTNTSQVTYNNYNYDVNNATIITPSMHKFNQKYVDGEIIIKHTSNITNKILYVCIPIIKSNKVSQASLLIGQIMSYISTNIPTKGNISNLNISNFTLNSVVMVFTC